MQIAIYALIFVSVTSVLGFPLYYYEHFVREHQVRFGKPGFCSVVY